MIIPLLKLFHFVGTRETDVPKAYILPRYHCRSHWKQNLPSKSWNDRRRNHHRPLSKSKPKLRHALMLSSSHGGGRKNSSNNGYTNTDISTKSSPPSSSSSVSKKQYSRRGCFRRDCILSSSVYKLNGMMTNEKMLIERDKARRKRDYNLQSI